METVIGLADKLCCSEAIFEEEVQTDRWILFAADHPGLPIVVPNQIRALLREFDGRKTVSEVLEHEESTAYALSTVGFLLDNGYLKFEPSPLPYSLPPSSDIAAPSAVGVWLHLTNDCNLQCNYCFVADKHTLMMTDEVASRTARALATTARTYDLQKMTVKFAGGEPTLAISRAESFRSDLRAQLVGTSTKLAFAILTNGTVLNRRVLEFLRQRDTSLTISIDGLGSAHDTFRIFRRTGQGSWDTIQRNLGILRDNGIKPFIAATISSETCHSLPELLKWVHDSGFKARLNVVRQADCSWQRTIKTESAYARVCSHLMKAFGRAFEELESPHYSFEFVSQLRLCDLHFDDPVLAPCGIRYNHIVVRPDGRIVSCPMAIDDEGVEPGDDLLEACRGSFAYNPAERRQQAECLSCRWFPVCAGGCPITNLRMNGEPFSKSPFCELYRFLIPAFIRLLAHKMIQQEIKGGKYVSEREIEGGKYVNASE